MSTADEIKADILATRAELAETADAIAAKLDVRAQAKTRLHATAQRAREKAPEPVRQAYDKMAAAAQPLVNAATEDKKRTAMVAGGAVLGLLLLLRVRNHRN